MNFLFDSIDWIKKYTMTFILTKKNKKPICFLSEAYDRNIEINLDTLGQLTFSIPYYIEDVDSHQKIKNPNYDKVVEENMVLVKCGDIQNPSFEAYFIIKTITESTDKLSKKVECKSRETLLNKNILTLDGVERQLTKTNSPDVSDGIFDFLASETTWSLGHIDNLAQFESINGGTNPKYRWFDAFSKPWLQFLHDDVQSAYDVVLMYDTVQKQVNVYDRKTYGTHTGIILSEENYIKNLNKKISAENIVTKLDCTGRDDLTFEGVNPLGTTYILNYDYFRRNGQMSEELSSALDKYDVLINQKNTEFQALKSQVDDLNGQIIVAQSQLSTYNEELKGLNGIRQGYMEANDNVHLPQATKDVNNKMSQIGQKQNQITTLKNQITAIQSKMSVVSSAIDKNNARDTHGALIFNDDLLEELEDFTYTESWNNNYYSTADSLLSAAKDVLADWSVPPIEFDMDLADFFSVVEMQHYWGKIKIGDLVRVYSSKLNTNVDVRIVSYSYNIDSNNLKITFSNKDKKLDDTRNIGSTIRKANDSSKLLNVKKISWNTIKDTNNAVETFLSNNLDLSRQQVVSQLGKNKINITENGIFVIDADDEDRQIAMLSGLIAITNDGWNSCATCITADGIAASTIIGRLLLGEQLYIEDADGTVHLDGLGMTIKDQNGKLKVKMGKLDNGDYGITIYSLGGDIMISSQGMLMVGGASGKDNVDSTHPLRIKFFIPNEVLSIKSISLNFSLQNFRTYETLAGQSATTTTSAGGGVDITGVSQKWGNPIYVDSFSNVLYMVEPVQGGNGVYVKFDDFKHTHPYSSPAHTHSLVHTHPLTYSIYEGAKASNVNITINGTQRTTTGYNADTNIVDITQWIQTGWNEILLSSDTLGRIEADVSMLYFLGI